ncbi:hypothetical protein OB915_25650 [Klebsiella pneumoniae]|nr:hypothetical protein [Klebsiella pneumoniae]HBR1098191.1 hypothetical protein [Klebsiella pneumoniae]
MTKWITINGSHVKVDENGNVITGGGGNIPNKNSADPTKHEPPEYVKKNEAWGKAELSLQTVAGGVIQAT